jgi:cation diffusion facilitator CzcD-associated flavoprotein CzcO
MSGLFSGYLLDNAGFHNYEIIEANDRLGGYEPIFRPPFIFDIHPY